MREDIVIIGGGLAGSEAAWQAANRGAKVTLYEMRPKEQTAAHKTGYLAELVCSNSLGSGELQSAPGLLKEEMRRLRSEEHTSELQSPCNLVCRLLLEKKKSIRSGDRNL